ncbi:3-deoxy-manno-octulosonate cytidylyltransferase [uncultured Mitsuokella sp.]|uniref:3-deoxy-manno-octulosonate cytidylyltransferase n=1 Tax=uncultured Mitsuokella sp. TaxID=453120 RepID=UPI002608C410|nr:3-deoxy-manno-octulosonate cytidylyltransferase [uncultured Mitsuokella sp.]
MKVLCVIPARYASTRLPGKPLKDIAGKPMICRVYDRASEAEKIAAAIVATDDERIYEAVRQHGGQAVMTRKDHPTGTDRLAEVAEKYPDVDLIINVQGDEPLIEPSLIDELAAAFEEDAALQMATVCTEIQDKEEQENPNNVKVVMDKNGYALYFSRSLMPYPRHAGTPVYKHIGIYAYKRDFLLRYAKMEETPLEHAESLEQLRALENGYRIKVIKTPYRFVGVDTEENLAKVNEIFRQMANA